MTERTCTVRAAVTGACGKPAVYVEGEFAECAECAAMPGALALGAHRPAVERGPAVGAPIEVHRHGKVYVGRVVRVTRGGIVYAEVTYGTGATRVVEAARI